MQSKRSTILIIDDEKQIIELLVSHFRRRNYEPIATVNPRIVEQTLQTFQVDLILLDTGTRIVVSSAVARSTVMAFVFFLVPLAILLVNSKHQEVVQEDQALIREVAQHVQPQENAIVFDHVNPKHKVQLKKRLSVRAKGRTFQLANARFESVSEERTVRKETEKRGAQKSLVVSRQREEQMRVVLDLEDVGMPDNIVLFSSRGPLTICEQKISLAGGEQDKGPIS